MGTPPSGCTVITRLKSHSGVLASLGSQHLGDVGEGRPRRGRSRCPNWPVVQSRSRFAVAEPDMVPFGMSRPMAEHGSMVAEAGAAAEQAGDVGAHVGPGPAGSVRPDPAEPGTAAKAAAPCGASALWTTQSRKCGLPPSST